MPIIRGEMPPCQRFFPGKRDFPPDFSESAKSGGRGKNTFVQFSMQETLVFRRRTGGKLSAFRRGRSKRKAEMPHTVLPTLLHRLDKTEADAYNKHRRTPPYGGQPLVDQLKKLTVRGLSRAVNTLLWSVCRPKRPDTPEIGAQSTTVPSTSASPPFVVEAKSVSGGTP